MAAIAAASCLIATCSGPPPATNTLAPTAPGAPTTAAAVASDPPTPEPTTLPPPASTSTEATPTARPPYVFVADEQLFVDDMADRWSGWEPVPTSYFGGIGFVDGALEFTLPSPGYWIWTRRNTSAGWHMMHTEGKFTPAEVASGWFGPMCGNLIANDFFAGVVSTYGSGGFLRVEGNEYEVLDWNLDVGTSVRPGQQVTIGLDCAGTVTGLMRLTLSVDGQQVTSYENVEGVATFDRVGLITGAESDDFLMRVDDTLAAGGRGE
jgi:hypothetical protein